MWASPVDEAGGGHARVTDVTTAVEPAMLVAPAAVTVELARGSVCQAATYSRARATRTAPKVATRLIRTPRPCPCPDGPRGGAWGARGARAAPRGASDVPRACAPQPAHSARTALAPRAGRPSPGRPLPRRPLPPRPVSCQPLPA